MPRQGQNPVIKIPVKGYGTFFVDKELWNKSTDRAKAATIEKYKKQRGDEIAEEGRTKHKSRTFAEHLAGIGANFAQGLGWNFADEGYAAGSSAIEHPMDVVRGVGNRGLPPGSIIAYPNASGTGFTGVKPASRSGFTDAYVENLQDARDYYENYGAAQPGIALTAELAGAFLPSLVPFAGPAYASYALPSKLSALAARRALAARNKAGSFLSPLTNPEYALSAGFREGSRKTAGKDVPGGRHSTVKSAEGDGFALPDNTQRQADDMLETYDHSPPTSSLGKEIDDIANDEVVGIENRVMSNRERAEIDGTAARNDRAADWPGAEVATRPWDETQVMGHMADLYEESADFRKIYDEYSELAARGPRAGSKALEHLEDKVHRSLDEYIGTTIPERVERSRKNLSDRGLDPDTGMHASLFDDVSGTYKPTKGKSPTPLTLKEQRVLNEIRGIAQDARIPNTYISGLKPMIGNVGTPNKMNSVAKGLYGLGKRAGSIPALAAVGRNWWLNNRLTRGAGAGAAHGAAHGAGAAQGNENILPGMETGAYLGGGAGGLLRMLGGAFFPKMTGAGYLSSTQGAPLNRAQATEYRGLTGGWTLAQETDYAPQFLRMLRPGYNQYSAGQAKFGEVGTRHLYSSPQMNDRFVKSYKSFDELRQEAEKRAKEGLLETFRKETKRDKLTPEELAHIDVRTKAIVDEAMTAKYGDATGDAYTQALFNRLRQMTESAEDGAMPAAPANYLRDLITKREAWRATTDMINEHTPSTTLAQVMGAFFNLGSPRMEKPPSATWRDIGGGAIPHIASPRTAATWMHEDDRQHRGPR